MPERLAPEGKLDLAAVRPLHEWLCNNAGQDVVLDLGKVSQFGTLCVQTCVAAARHSKSSGNRFQISNASDQVLAQLSSMGLTPETIEEGAQ